MEFTSDANALGADAGISFIVDRFNQIHLDGGTQAFSSVCWTRVHERLRAFTGCLSCSVHAVIVMGCDGGLLSAGGSVEPLMCVVQELCNL